MSMAAYIQHVEQLTDDELCSHATRLAGITLKHTAELIAHIRVIADKRAFRPEYTSLFTYCVNELGLSESETHVRTQVANVCRRHPQLLDSLGANRMSLTVAEFLVQFKHGKEVTPGIRAVSPTITLPAPTNDDENRDPMSEGSSAPNLPVPNSPRLIRHIEPVKPDVFNFRFAASGAFKSKLERLAEVVGVVDVTGNLAKLLDIAIEHALEANDPQRKLERRRKRDARKASAEQESSVASVGVSSRLDEMASTTEPEIALPVVPSKPPSRYVPSELRELVFERANYRCEFARDGVRCEERTGLQVDHIVPHGMHGPTELANLRCFCGVHNRWVAEQVYGKEFMRAKIEEARRKKAGVRRRVPSGQLPLTGG
ncbi:MAG: HNH endonuclease [Planctomycetes bacterium]|nr:HNH endonuclease [Planctomycetota bacterium]